MNVRATHAEPRCGGVAQIVAMEDNSKQPLSFRACGAWTALNESVSDVTRAVDDWNPNDLKSLVDELLVRSESDAARVAKQISNIDDNLRIVEELFARLKEIYPDAVTSIWVE